MGTKIWMSSLGRAVDPEHATISVFDRGFLYGDSVYETMRTAGGRVVELEPHLDRLWRSAAGIAFELPFGREQLRAAIDETLAAAGNPDSRIRLVVTRGTGPIALDMRVAESPVAVVMVTPLSVPDEAARTRGISAVIVSGEGAIAGLKTGSYLGNILALRKAHEDGADDAIMCNAEGAVAEGATSNVFMVDERGGVSTPSLATGLLAGITRGVVLELLRGELGVEVHEGTIWPDQLRGAAEVFMTSSVRGVMPVTTLDGARVGAGEAGPLTVKLAAAYDRYLDGQSRR